MEDFFKIKYFLPKSRIVNVVNKKLHEKTVFLKILLMKIYF